jgi:RNA polymerase sigma factor (sigma-70 family)
MTQTNILLREYANNGSESAFHELVDQYVDLVFSTAVRRFGGDRHRAEDATQIVFTDLARKAKTLPPDVMLGGWLHHHCCFVVSNLTRAESRRVAREREAVIMEDHHSEDANWSEVAPELDDAINSLQQEDRDAIVLRFFERKDFRAIGEVIGGTENAAQKRVARALDKLRQLLAQRGVALSGAALMTALASEVIAAAPAALARRASESALKSSAAKTAAAVGATGGVALAVWSLLAAVVIAVVSIAIVGYQPKENISQKSTAAANASRSQDVSTTAANPGAIAPAGTNPDSITQPAQPGPTLRLTIVAADTGNPVPNVPIEYHSVEGKRRVDKSLQSSRAGLAVIPFTSDTTELRLTTRTEAFADTRLFWQTKDAAIPTEYTLRLKRGITIGGKVVNSRGELVPEAVVEFSMPIPDPELSQKTENHEIENVQIIAEDGTWQTSRIPESLLRRMHARASHPDYAGSETPYDPTPAATIDLFLKGKHVFTLRDAITVRGFVVNKQNEPVPNAKILVGSVHNSDSKEGVAGADGRFEIRGAAPGKTTVTASAKGYGANTVAVDSPPREEGYRIALEPGRLLKLRFMNLKSEPIPKAYAWLKTMDNGIQNPTNAPLIQAEFEGRSDAEGLVEWDEAPADELTFDFAATGYMRREQVKVPADGVEHTITLLPALKIIGEVRDATTGMPMPKFRVIAGWPSDFIAPGQKQQIHWSTIDRYWLHGSNGRFEWTFEDAIVYGVATNRYTFKIEADGYKAFTTRIINEDECEVHLDIPLQSGNATMLTILAPDGNPAPDVDVAFPQARAFLRLGGRGFNRNPGNPVILSDSKGQVRFPDDEPAKIVAAGPPGFAMINPADLPADGTIRLQPWGRVEGKVSRRGKPLEGWKLHIGTESSSESIALMAGDTITGADGTFTINYAPPGHLKLVHLARTDQTTAYTHVPIRDLDIAPGETANGDYEEKGITATFRLRWPENFARAKEHRVFCQASVPFERPSPEIMRDPAALARWRERPDVKAALAKMRDSTFAETEPGVWSTENLEPGEWIVNAMVIEEKPNPTPGQPNLPLLVGALKAQIPENTAADKIDLGELALSTPPPATIPQ